uniref:RING-type domain-containing protein n=1 Tax=Palpitomonas bilix TaxID=652834 RepID=A0A7S3GB91_9EUKA
MSISDKVEVDMLGLSDAHLQAALGVKEISGVQSTAEEILRTIHTQKELIEGEEELPKSLRTKSSLSSFLSGSTPAGVEVDPRIVAAAAALSRTKACRCSRWRCEFGPVWGWLVETKAKWDELEGRIEAALARNSTMADAPMLDNLLQELRSSSVVSKKLSAELKKRIQSIASAAIAKDDSDEEEEQGRMCRQCGRYPVSFQLIPCKHECMCRACVRQSLGSQEAFDMLLEKRAHVILPGGAPICCPECEQAAMVIVLSE